MATVPIRCFCVRIPRKCDHSFLDVLSGLRLYFGLVLDGALFKWVILALGGLSVWLRGPSAYDSTSCAYYVGNDGLLYDRGSVAGSLWMVP